MKKWICNVCGYVHEGNNPPDTCPICGVGAEEFSLVAEPKNAIATTSKWVCKICGYVHEGGTPPDTCPLCGVGPEEFMLMEKQQESKPVKQVTPIKRWKCTVCDYIQEGDQPPETCPVCGVGKEFFILLGDEVKGVTVQTVAAADETTMNAALNEISYGLYIVSSTKNGKINGQTANSVFQLTYQPPQIAVCINKRNLTHEYILANGRLAVSIISKEDCDIAKEFGYRSGRDVDKYAKTSYVLGKNGCPILTGCVSYLEAEVIPEKTVDVGTHTLFVAKVTSGMRASEITPLTYSYYRQMKFSPTKS